MHRTSLICVIGLLLILESMPAAASVLQLSINQIAQGSEFIFEGQVLQRESRLSPVNRMIHTYITFAVLEIIKGDYKGRYLTVSFLGGTVGDQTLEVSDMHVPAVAEHEIYFLESINRTISDPRFGGDQGHFVIRPEPATGKERVTCLNGSAVTGFSSAGSAGSFVLSSGVATGLRYHTGDAAGGMSPADFKMNIKRIMVR